MNNIIDYLTNKYTFDLAYDYDNVGITVDNKKYSSYLFTLDVNIEVINEAISLGCDVIITHHPFPFIKEETGDEDYNNKMLELLNEKKISIYSIHTNFDNHIDGLNTKVCNYLSFKNIKKSHDIHGIHTGNVEDFSIEKFVEFLKGKFSLSSINYVKSTEKVSKVGLFLGSTADEEFIDICVKLNVDTYICGDLKYSKAEYAKKSNLNIIDVTHFSEKIGMKLLFEEIKHMFNDINVYLSSDSGYISYK